ncbi:MAG TPA: ABC transporter ATP-binding protein, partial [Patescibacteria group bacterium]|nr:ABC transporter ATP-binding protein [Patescibacteria group bacterium]
WEFIDQPVKHYSSGMYLRLAFAVAVHVDPEILLVDEILAVGDVEFQKKCLNRIRDYLRSGGTLLLVSHDMKLVRSVCTRIVHIENGRAVNVYENTPGKQRS